jgi:hypothetical protein
MLTFLEKCGNLRHDGLFRIGLFSGINISRHMQIDIGPKI